MKEFEVTRKKIIFRIIITVLLIGLICFGVYMKQVFDYKQTVENMTFDKIDISALPDGTYTGECNVNFIYAKVDVTVNNGEISNIDIIEHRNDRGEAAEKIVDKIVSEQSLEVDAISGATNSSKVIKKAIENALMQH